MRTEVRRLFVATRAVRVTTRRHAISRYLAQRRIVSLTGEQNTNETNTAGGGGGGGETLAAHQVEALE
jgi:hypothetical protein